LVLKIKLKKKHSYEIAIKLDPSLGPTDSPARVGPVLEFIQRIYPDAQLLSENGGLLTFMVPNGSMKVINPAPLLHACLSRVSLEHQALPLTTSPRVDLLSTCQR
jgi:hypothetical protein